MNVGGFFKVVTMECWNHSCVAPYMV